MTTSQVKNAAGETVHEAPTESQAVAWWLSNGTGSDWLYQTDELMSEVLARHVATRQARIARSGQYPPFENEGNGVW